MRYGHPVTYISSLLAAVLLAPVTVAAQSWPVKPIRFMIVQAPGGQNDVQLRLIGPRLAEALGQPIIYDNRPGAGGALGFELFAQTPPDVYATGSALGNGLK